MICGVCFSSVPLTKKNEKKMGSLFHLKAFRLKPQGQLAASSFGTAKRIDGLDKSQILIKSKCLVYLFFCNYGLKKISPFSNPHKQSERERESPLTQKFVL